MKNFLFIILAIGLVILGGLCFYFKTQIDTARNNVLDLNAIVNSQEVKIGEIEAELSVTRNDLDETLELNKGLLEAEQELKQELIEMEQELDNAKTNLLEQTARALDLQAELEEIQSELQLYHDTGILVSQGVVPPYRKSPIGNYDLQNNPDAVNISWEQLKDFLKEDRTDNNLYIENFYMCGEFAETLHNNAESEGIKAAWVAINFEDQSIPHALNAFVTTDKGLVYIDTTGTEFGTDRPKHMDCLVMINVGQRLDKDLLFAPNWEIRSIGSKVSQVEIYW